MLLHIISKSPLKHSALNDALPFINGNDTVIFIDDGVYANIADTPQTKELSEKNCTITALIDDMKARGLNPENMLATPREMSDFVELAFNANKSVSWY